MRNSARAGFVRCRSILCTMESHIPPCAVGLLHWDSSVGLFGLHPRDPNPSLLNVQRIVKRIPACSYHLRYMHVSPITTLFLLLQLTLIGEARRCNSWRALHNELLSHRRQKHKFKFSSSNREETTKQNGWKSSHASLLPVVEDGTMPAPPSVRLKASSNAVGLFICAFHNACRTVAQLSICRSLLRS